MRRLLLSVLAVLILPLSATALSVSAQTVEPYQGPIIDMHLHSFSPEDYWGVLPSPATGRLSPGSAEEHRTLTLEAMRRHNIVLGSV